MIRRLAAVAATVTALTLPGSAPAAAADVEAGRQKAQPCAACHGPDGNATIPGIPSLAGQPSMYTHWQLIKFRDGRRKDPQMTPFAERLGDADMADLAAYYASQRPRPGPSPVDPAKLADGKRIAEYYHCTSCHRPDFRGHEQVPRLAGQDLTYLLRLIRGFKDRTASDLDGTMTMAAQPLRPEDIDALAHYIASVSR
jgi:cytochrome c553